MEIQLPFSLAKFKRLLRLEIVKISTTSYYEGYYELYFINKQLDLCNRYLKIIYATLFDSKQCRKDVRTVFFIIFTNTRVISIYQKSQKIGFFIKNRNQKMIANFCVYRIKGSICYIYIYSSYLVILLFIPKHCFDLI